MVKHEIKVEISNSEQIKNIIEKSYFEEGYAGKIMGKNHYLTITEDDDINYTIFKGLNGATVKILNDEVIDGAMRFMIDETNGDIRLYPISIYCIREVETNKYIFY
jgi:hypothetical protein